MKLYGFWRSTATWRVRIALAWKGLDHAYQPINLTQGEGEQHSDVYAALNPMRQVPLLELPGEGGVVRIAQSMAILEYLEERYPTPPLLPRDAVARAHVRQIAEMVNSGIQPLQNTGVQRHLREVVGIEPRAWVAHWVARGLAAIEEVAAEVAGRFCVGDAVSFADAALVPELYFARRFRVPLERYPTLTRVEAECATLPAFQRAHAEQQPDAPAR